MSHTSSRGGPPSIRIYDSGTARHGPYPMPLSLPRHHPSHSAIPASPMPIPHAREAPPPPLPPPRYISGLDTGHHGADHPSHARHASWQQLNSRNGAGVASQSGSSRSGLSLLGAMRAKAEISVDPDNFITSPTSRNSSSTTAYAADTDMPDAPDASDDEPHSTSTRPSIVSRRLHSESQLGQRSLENSSNAYDKQLLARMGGPQSASVPSSRPPAATSSILPTITQDSQLPLTAALSPRQKLTGQLKPLAVPDRRYNSMEPQLSRWASAPSSGISPGNTSFRSPFDAPSQPDSAKWRASSSLLPSDVYEDNRPKRNCDEQGVFSDNDFTMEEDGAMRDTNMAEMGSVGSDEAQLASGHPRKRQAQSPPPEHRASAGHELQRRRSAQMLNSRSASMSSRYAPAQGSVSSVSSLGHKTGSYASTMSWNYSLASSITSYGEQASPNTLSPAGEPDYAPISPYVASRSLNPSPQDSAAKSSPHQRTFSESEPSQNRKMSNDSVTHSRQNSVSHRPGLLICECCPKKPKKFESVADLRAHEQEKQYQCQYCPNRFKNKNEAERHQSSIHLRLHSWSCAALMGVHAAFHPSSQPPSVSDVCGYCGEEFPNPPNWDVRSDHLNTVHKYGECNQQKKFFRADHFRQHLKHSHAGSPGKWTNVLENACMKDEPPPPLPTTISQKDRVGSVAASTGMSLSPTAAMPPTTSISGVINEVQDES